MSESKGSLIAKSVQKHAGRAKEKILQNLGKVDRTADDIFDEHLQNFTRQHSLAVKLHKEFSNYLRCVRAIQAASKTLLEAIGDIYESQWSGHDFLYMQIQSVDMLWQDLSHKLADQVLIPLNTYQSQFVEMRKKVDKRGRKLVDYDGQRHNFQALQIGMSKKRDDAKLSKGREQLEEAKRTYDILNSELHDELPALYDSRILFLVTNLQSLFSAQQVFHIENAKVFTELEAVVDKLATDSQRGSYSVKTTNGSTLPRSTNNTPSSEFNNISPPSNTISKKAQDLDVTTKIGFIPSVCEQRVSYSPEDLSADSVTVNTNANSPVHEPVVDTAHTAVSTASSLTNSPNIHEIDECGESDPVIDTPKNKNDAFSGHETKATDNVTDSLSKRVEELYDIPTGATTDNLPAGVLYRVKATYKYSREDVDELSFDANEIIQVVEYDDPDEQEDGWLMGLRETTGEKGMFPANFTKPL